MKNYFLVIICLFIVSSCAIKKYKNPYQNLYSGYNSVEIQTLVEDSTLNVRAIELVSITPDKVNVCAFLTSKGEFGTILPNHLIKHLDSLKDKDFYVHKISLTNDTLNLNFRALALRENLGFGISIGDPALLYSLDADLEKNKIVYKESHPKVFYDSMEFWNDMEGIAIGDPTHDCMSIIITRDGGQTWNKLSCDVLPKANDGEAAFAASDTNIAIVGDKTWVATGGKSSRILFSPDKGKSWKVYNTPIIQGKETTGMYSIDFYDENNGFAIGGDYTKPDDAVDNKIRTADGGKTWEVVANGKSPGYRSCVKYVPNRNAKELVAVGFKGIDYSNDTGETWKHLSDEGFYTIRFLNDSIAYAAGNGRISKLIFK